MKSIAVDQGKIWTSPLRIKKRDLKIIIPVVTLSTTAILFDEDIYKGFKKFQNKNDWVSTVSPIITYMGDDKTSIGIYSGLLIGGAIFKEEKVTQTAIMGYQTFVHCGIVIQVMKHAFSRQRPSVENGNDKWNGPLKMFNRYSESFSKYDAFPSGHTIMAWGLATVVSEQYKQFKWVPYTMYSLATVAGLSRVTEDTHWVSDVIIGGALGYGIGRYITKAHKNTKWTLLPYFGNERTGMSLLIRL